MLHLFFAGLLLGYGAAIPIGPLNIEIVRRNLRFGASRGVAIGLGACSADLTYLLLLAIGVLLFLTHPTMIRIVSFIGAIILAWFGINALRMKTTDISEAGKNKPDKHFIRHYLEGYALTLLNPYTVLFWLSVSSQIAVFSHTKAHSLFWVALGVIIATISWALGLNLVIHCIRHKISAKTMHRLNLLGGIILLGFAAYGFYHALR